MNAAFVFLWMVFFHIIDDFILQPICLSSLKQKSYWQENAPDKLYKYDYVCALITHSISWTFMIMLPIAYVLGFTINPTFVIIFIFNTILHAIIDDQKANQKSINLWHDQLCHMIQIALTFVLFFA